MNNYPMEINGWNYSGDADCMSYWKDYNQAKSEWRQSVAVSLCWLDTAKGDDGYNPEGDVYCCLEAEGRNAQDALNNLYDTNCCFGDVMRRDEAEKYLIKYMETH